MAVGVAAEVKNKLSIVDVVGETVTLKKAGTTFKGLCPFHGEKTPSFVVTPMRESWKCFGCGLGGDVFSFVMQRDGLTFPECPRWHDGALWFADVHAHKIMRMTADGHAEAVIENAHQPAGHTT